jgi:predicted site-specific integrase-resolvase
MTSKRALLKWIEAGLLEATQTGSEWYVMAEDAARFRETYCIAAEAMRLLKRNRSTLTRWEAAGHLAPVDGTRMTRQVGFTLYQRADIQRLKDTTPMRRRRTAQSNNKNQSNSLRKDDACI